MWCTITEKNDRNKGGPTRSQSWVLGSPWLRYTRRETGLIYLWSGVFSDGAPKSWRVDQSSARGTPTASMHDNSKLQ